MTETYLTELQAALAPLPPAERAEVVAEVTSLLTDPDAGEVLRELGDPRSLAARMIAERSTEGEPADPQGEFAGLPYDLRGPDDDRLRARLFNPADDRLFMPHLFGMGWSINLGAVAVRLGLLRPDDLDAEVEAAIPPAALLAARSLPLAVAVAATAAAGRTPPAARSGLLAGAWLPAVVGLARSGKNRAPVTGLTWVALATAVQILIMGGRLPKQTGAQRALRSAAMLGAPVVAFAQLVLPVRLGLRKRWAARS